MSVEATANSKSAPRSRSRAWVGYPRSSAGPLHHHRVGNYGWKSALSEARLDDNAKMTGGSDVSASEQLDKLADRAKQSEENIAHAKEEGQAELKARVERARESSEQHAAELLKSGASGAKAKGIEVVDRRPGRLEQAHRQDPQGRRQQERRARRQARRASRGAQGGRRRGRRCLRLCRVRGSRVRGARRHLGPGRGRRASRRPLRVSASSSPSESGNDACGRPGAITRLTRTAGRRCYSLESGGKRARPFTSFARRMGARRSAAATRAADQSPVRRRQGSAGGPRRPSTRTRRRASRAQTYRRPRDAHCDRRRQGELTRWAWPAVTARWRLSALRRQSTTCRSSAFPLGRATTSPSIWESPGTTCSERSTPSRPDSSAGSTWPRSTAAHF